MRTSGTPLRKPENNLIKRLLMRTTQLINMVIEQN